MRENGILKRLTTITVLTLMLCLLPVTAHAMPISVNGTSVEVESSDTISAVIQKLEEQQLIAQAQGVMLVYQGKAMESGRTLADYGVGKSAVLYVRCDDCNPTTDGSGVCSVCTFRHTAAVTAGGTTTYYDSADAAFSASDGATVTILMNASTQGADQQFNLMVNSGVTLTANGALTTGGSISGGGTIAGAGPLTVSPGGTINGITVNCAVINNGTISSGTFGAVENNGTISGGTFHGALVNHGTVMADNMTIGSGFTFTNPNGTISNDSHKHSTPVTCKDPKTCIFCGEAEGTPDLTAHSFSNHVCSICGVVQLHEGMVSLSSTTFIYNGAVQKPVVTVQYAGTALTENTDYLVSMTQGANAGSYSVTVTAARADAYTGSVTVGYTIDPAPLDTASVTLDKDAFVYDGTVHKSVPAVMLAGFGTLKADEDYTVLYTKAKSTDGNNNPTAWDGPQDCIHAGAYFAVIQGKNNFSSQSSYSVYAPFKIEKATPGAEHFRFDAPENKVYDGKKKTVTVTPRDGISGMGNMTLRVTTGEDAHAVANVINAGTYRVGITVAEGENFKASDAVITGDNWEFAIGKAAPVVSEPSAAVLAYSGKAQKLVTAGVAAGSETIYYRLGGNDPWTTAVPTATKAGEYTVSWYAGSENSQNYKYASGTIKAQIKPAAITITPDANQKMTYGDPKPKLTYTVTGAVAPEVPVFTGALSVNSIYAGTHEIKQGSLALKDNGAFHASNYTIVLNPVKFTIDKAPLRVTAENQTITHGSAINKERYGNTAVKHDDILMVTLTPSTTNITYGGTITATVSVEDTEGKSVSDNYIIECTVGKLVIKPNLSAIKGLTTENVNATAEAGIKALQTALGKADTQKADSEEKKEIEEAKKTCTALLTRIEAAAKAIGTEGIKNTAAITADNVKLEDEAAILQAIGEIEKAKTAYGGNYTAEESKKLDEQITNLKAAQKTIENAKSVIKILTALPETIRAEDEEAAGVRAAISLLTERERGLVSAAGGEKRMAAVDYKFLSGNDAIWEGKKSLRFEIDGDYTRFTGIRVDGKNVDEKFYKAEPGSTVITLKKSYLKKVSNRAEHTITIQFDDGQLSGNFRIHEDAISAAFDFTGFLIWTAVVFACTVTTVIAYIYLEKKK